MTIVRKAVIPAAGLGSRFLPYTKAVPKEMLPVVDRPVIQYVVAEAVEAGIDDILIVTSRHKKAIEDHFDRVTDLEDALVAAGKAEQAAELKAISEMADIHFVRQGEARGLGHAIGLARSHVGDEPFVAMVSDRILHARAGVLPGMITAYNQHRCSVVALTEVGKDEISSFGSVAAEPLSDRVVDVHQLVEKPDPDDAPSNLAIMGRYLFTPEIFDIIDRTPPGTAGEIQITDAMTLLLQRDQILGFTFTEGRFDTGTKLE
ncbi:MAG: UTP--glucose-1-phosphate uridylyltransferase GalU, partial [Actinomycetota bacterium]